MLLRRRLLLVLLVLALVLVPVLVRLRPANVHGCVQQRHSQRGD